MINKCWIRIYADVIKHDIKKLEEIEDDELREEVRKYIEEKMKQEAQQAKACW